jgi:hypothetical protein
MFILVEPPHPATLEPGHLLKQCQMSFGRTAGPGGQHRNKVETQVNLKHVPTGVVASASERRSQAQNRHRAIWRLRVKLATQARVMVHPQRYQPTRLWCERRQGVKLPVNPRHPDYPGLLAEAMDVIVARGFDVAGAAGMLGVTMSQLVKLVRHEKQVLAIVNEGRTSRGLPALA